MEQRILDLLEHDHEELSRLLNELQSALTKRDPARAFQLLDRFWARLAMHIRAENLHLFPAILDTVSSHKAAGMPATDEVKKAVDILRSEDPIDYTKSCTH